MRAIASVAVVVSLVAAGAPAAAAEPLVGTDRVYVTNSALVGRESSVGRFTADAAGVLTPADGAKASRGARGLVFTPDVSTFGQRFAYLASEFAGDPTSQPLGGIESYRVAPNGALTPIGLVRTESAPFGIAIAPSGHTVYVANRDAGSISAYEIGTTGALTLRNTVPSGAPDAKGVTVTPDGRFVYVSHGETESGAPSLVTGLAVGFDGSLVGVVAKQEVGPSGQEVRVTPDGRHLYVTNQVAEDGADVYGFSIDARGDLTPVPGKPVEAGVWVEGAAVSPDGRRLYTTALGVVGADGRRDGQLRGFAIGADGRLTEIARVDAASSDPVALAFGTDGQHLYVSDFSDSIVTSYQVGPAGQLTPIQKVASQGENPAFQSVVVLPGARI